MDLKREKYIKREGFHKFVNFFQDRFSFTMKTQMIAKVKIARRIASKTITCCDLDLTPEERRVEEQFLTEKNILEIACQESKIWFFRN